MVIYYIKLYAYDLYIFFSEVYFTSLVSQRLKHLSTMRETQVQSLGQEDPLEKEMATHSSTLAWRIPWTEEPGGLQSTGVTKSQTQLSDLTFIFQLKKKKPHLCPNQTDLMELFVYAINYNKIIVTVTIYV